MAEQSWQKDGRSPGFVNPYNFVPLSDVDVARGFAAGKSKGELSGVIECTLRTRTPLAMPDLEDLPVAQQDGEEHKGLGLERGVPFFRVPSRDGSGERAPTIPGSELRGVIRSAFEALDNGCLSVNNSNIASARSPLPLEPAVLEVSNGVLSLFAARKVPKRGRVPHDAVRRSWPELGGGRVKSAAFVKRGLLGGFSDAQLRDALSDYFKTVEIYKQNADDAKNFELTHTVIPEQLPASGSWVVFYLLLKAFEGSDQEDVLFLSPAQITRTVFRNRVNDLLGSHAGCVDPSKLCEVCSLFGMVGEGGAASSKLRFSDATLQLREGQAYEDCMIPSVTLKELSSPKPSSLEFYTKRPLDAGGNPALTWTYDGATMSYMKREKIYKPIIDRYPPEMPTLVRGRKFYLHHYADGDEADAKILKACKPKADGADAKTKRNMTVEVVRSGTEFTFRVFFDGIDEDQLEKLVWTLCIGENDLGGEQMHKLGHAKPLGLGSAKIVVNRVMIRSLASGYGFKPWDIERGLRHVAFVDEEVVRAYRIITNYNLAKGLNVCYPLADDMGNSANSQASHNWFVANRSVGKGGPSSMTPSAYRALPKLPSSPEGRSVLVLPKFVKNSRVRQTDISYPFEMNKEETVSMAYEPRHHGVIADAMGSPEEGRYYGHIRREGATNLFFHTSRSPKLDLNATPLESGMRVSYLIGKNEGGDKTQDIAIDIRVEE